MALLILRTEPHMSVHGRILRGSVQEDRAKAHDPWPHSKKGKLNAVSPVAKDAYCRCTCCSR